MKKICFQCGNHFDCGHNENDQGCWCTKFPKIFQVVDPAKADCFCPDCFLAEFNKKVEAYAREVQAGIRTNEVPLHKTLSDKLQEGIDYYIEDGHWVFTSWYHLKRGNCCGSGCRHCAYDHVNVRP